MIETKLDTLWSDLRKPQFLFFYSVCTSILRILFRTLDTGHLPDTNKHNVSFHEDLFGFSPSYFRRVYIWSRFLGLDP